MQADAFGLRQYTLSSTLAAATTSVDGAAVYRFPLKDPVFDHNVDPDLAKSTVQQVCCSRFTVQVEDNTVEGNFFGVGLRGLGAKGFIPYGENNSALSNVLAFGTAINLSSGTDPGIYTIQFGDKTWFDINVASQIQELEMFVTYVAAGDSAPGQPPTLVSTTGEFQFRTAPLY